MMMKFVSKNLDFFKRVSILTTGSTGAALEKKLGLRIARKVASGPLGGDQEIGGMVTNGDVAAAFFFVDPLSPHPHDADIRALTRIFEVHNVLCATNLITGEALVYALKTGARFRQKLSKTRVRRRKESEVVESYKAQQQRVVDAVAS
jgi:methylglyoxal synthase